ncbi:hypothetical protein KW783_01295, partial [Candidatus Parcubacteria bacterium]|nr:hypothetical protein [Candidatus Parcubacteria bacterium]
KYLIRKQTFGNIQGLSSYRFNSMNSFQKRIDVFVKERDWSQFFDPKDLLLGIVEEVGELRNLVKWERDMVQVKKVIRDNFEEFENNIGDMYWFLSLLASQNGVDLDTAIDKVITDNEKRFPVDKVKSKHTNPHFGGYDKQHGSK